MVNANMKVQSAVERRVGVPGDSLELHVQVTGISWVRRRMALHDEGFDARNGQKKYRKRSNGK